MQIPFRKRAINYRVLLQKMTIIKTQNEKQTDSEDTGWQRCITLQTSRERERHSFVNPREDFGPWDSYIDT